MNEKKVDRELLAYIQFDDTKDVIIDIVKTSRNGLSFHYKNVTWKRDIRHLGREVCTDPHGNKCKIVPLSRWYIPSWAENVSVEVTEEAKERYQLWMSKKLISARNKE